MNLLKKLKNVGIVKKVSIMVAVTLLVCLNTLVVISCLYSHKIVSEAVGGELSGIATENGIIVQNILDIAERQSKSIFKYMERQFEYYSDIENINSMLNTLPKETSQIYNAELSIPAYETEDYLLNSIWSTVEDNEDIVGIGALFEPYAFDAAVKDYCIYANREDARNRTSQHMSYEEYSVKDYYSVVKSTQKGMFTKPYSDQGITMVSASYPIIINGKFQGVVLTDINIENFRKLSSEDEIFESLYVNVCTEDSTIVYSSLSTDSIGKKLSDFIGDEYKKIESEMVKGTPFSVKTSLNPSDNTQVIRYYHPIKAEGGTWWAVTSVNESDFNHESLKLSILMLALGGLTLIIILAVVITYIRKVLKPIDKIVDAANFIKAGKLDISLDIDSQDEIGILAGNFTEMTDNLKAIIEDISYCLGSMGNGNFLIFSNCREKYVGDFQDILLSMKKIKADMTHTLSELNMAANQVNAGSEQISTAAQGLSAGATEQAASIEELSATIGEISEKIQQNAEDAQVAMQAVEDVGSGIVKSNEHMQELAAAMEEISNTSNQIDGIIKTIDDIAFQTNILALNAAVEAARAGMVGKGFAVVADEVRNLAGKSAEASKNISALIENTISAIEKSTAMTHETANSLSTVVGKADLVTERVAQITTASKEQADSAVMISTGIDQISAVIQTNSATAEQTAASSEELASQANMLNSLVSQFEFDAEQNEHINRTPQMKGNESHELE